MAERNFWQRIAASLERVYERRIRAASMAHDGDITPHGHTDATQEDSEAVVIANVPRGTRLGARPQPPGQSE